MASPLLSVSHSSFNTIFFFMFFLVFPCTPSAVRSEYSQSMCLAVPSQVFISAVESTTKEVQQALSIVSNFAKQFRHDLRLSSAISDCLELLDFTADELSFSLSAIQNRNGKDNSTGDRGADLKAWLSAALGNQDTCISGFEGTNRNIQSIIEPSLGIVTSQVGNALRMVHENPSPKKKTSKFPSWMTLKDRRLLQAPSGSVSPDVVVDMNGSGNFTNVTDAILASPTNSTTRFVIYVKKGVYKENVEIKKTKWNIMMIGDGMDATTISGNRNFIDGWTTFRTATFAVSGRGFIARDITFENNAGPEKHQAVALRSDSDLSAYYRCGIRGYQDTLYAHSLRQFYRECQITGTVDFMFGNSAAVFQYCEILARKGLPDQKNTITAHGRKDPSQTTGFSIQFSNISGDAGLLSSGNSTSTYLGRPWKQYSRTVFMQSYLSGILNVQGWLEWQGNFSLDTLYYGEYMNYGPGAGLQGRVKWPGYHALDMAQANNFTVAQFIDGNLWLPQTGVKYIAGLGN